LTILKLDTASTNYNQLSVVAHTILKLDTASTNYNQLSVVAHT